MFKFGISRKNAALYRRAVSIGINKARDEFHFTKRLPLTTPAPQLSIGEIVKVMGAEAVAYRNEKRKRGWVSAPTDSDDRGNGMHPAVMAAIAVM